MYTHTHTHTKLPTEEYQMAYIYIHTQLHTFKYTDIHAQQKYQII